MFGRPAARAWKFAAPASTTAHTHTLLPRQRLTALLDASLGKSVAGGSIFLITAPAGYGKSVTIAQWFQASGLPSAWLHLDASDNDPVTFTHDLIQALRRLAPRSAQWRAGAITPGGQSAWEPANIHRVAAALAEEISANIMRPAALAVTGVTELAEESGGLALLDAVLGRPVDHLRTLIETREAPALNISQALAQGRVAGIGARELRLEDDELDALLELIDAPDDPAYRQAVADLCAGWITGVLLATNALWPPQTPRRLAPTVGMGIDGDDGINHAAVSAYLAHEVLASLDEDELGFALAVAPLNYMTVSLCERLLDEPQARARLIQLEQHTGLVTRFGLRPQEARYAFQPFLRAALLRRLASETGGRERAYETRIKAGTLLAQDGDLEEAIKQFHAVGAYGRIVTVIESVRGTLLRAGRGATLERWLRLLPDDVRSQQPHLVILQAELTRQLGRTEEAGALAQRACALTQPLAHEQPQLAASALAVRAEVCFVQGDYAEARRASEAGLALAPSDADELQARLRFALAQCYNKTGQSEVAERLLKEAEAYCQRQGGLWLLARVAYFRSQIALLRGDYQQIERDSLDALRYAQEAGDEIIAISARLQLGAADHHLGKIEQAREHLETALRQSEDAHYQAGQAYALLNLGDIALRVGEYAQAIERFEQTIRVMNTQSDQRLILYTYALQGIALAFNGSVDHAEGQLRFLRRIRHRSSERTSDETQMILASAITAWKQNRRRAAEKWFAVAGRLALRGNSADDYATVQMYYARVLLDNGAQDDQQRAERLLEQACDTALTLTGQQKERAALVWLDARFHQPLRDALACVQHPVARQAIALLEALEAETGRTAEGEKQAGTRPRTDRFPSLANKDMQLRLYTLGEPRVLLGSEVVALWKHPQARDLLFFLAEQRKPVSKDVIHEALWPERDPEQFERALKKARLHLRESLGCEPLLQTGSSLSVAGDVWLDSHAFTALVSQGEELAQSGSLTEATRIFRQALSLWNGPYLPDHYEEWAILRKDALQRIALRCLERAAEVELALGRWDSAAQYCYRILETDPINENAYRGLMAAYTLNGEYSAAARAYQQCVATLRETLGVAPDPKTQQFWRSIQQRAERSVGRPPDTARLPSQAAPRHSQPRLPARV